MTQPETSVTKTIIVNVPVAHAFDVFTRRIDLWWPRTHHIGKAEMKEAVLEARAGGRWFERGVDGTECPWGVVLAWSPPTHVALSWQIDAKWQYEPDPAKGSRVDVRFSDLGDGRTRVELVHSHLDRHLDGWEQVKKSVSSEGGWAGILESFAASAAGAAHSS